MRILSQDKLHEGIIDVPYEQVSIEQRKNEIWCGYYPTLSQHCVGKLFAKYSAEAKAKRAMEMLRKKYLETYQWCSEVVYGENNYPKVFQFPSDDEIEV